MNSQYWKRALWAGLLVGTLDISAAMTQFFLKTGKDPRLVLKYVASGALGKEAVSGNGGMMLTGLLFHYLIATLFTFFFFWLYTRWTALRKYPVLTGIGYGIFMSLIMQGIVVPFSRTAKSPYNPVNSVMAAIILIICIGLPLSFLARTALQNSRLFPHGSSGKRDP